MSANPTPALFEYEPAPVPRLNLVDPLRTAPVFSDRPACAGESDLTDSVKGEKATAALRLCASCPVLKECQEWVQGEPDYSGVAGGAVVVPRTAHGRRSAPTFGDRK